MSSLWHMKAKSILLKISTFKSFSSIISSPDIKKFETCQYWLLWQYKVKGILGVIQNDCNFLFQPNYPFDGRGNKTVPLELNFW